MIDHFERADIHGTQLSTGEIESEVLGRQPDPLFRAEGGKWATTLVGLDLLLLDSSL